MANVQDMLAAANASVPTVGAEEVREMVKRGNTVIVDVRDEPEVKQTGKIRGAIHISRGMLEFRADPATPYHNPALQKDRTVVLYCASGGRSALGAKALQDLGYTSVYNAGGFTSLAEAGMETEPA